MTALRKPLDLRPTLSADEIDQRRAADAKARTHNRIEGLVSDPAVEYIHEAHILGQITTEEAIEQFAAFHKRAHGG